MIEQQEICRSQPSPETAAHSTLLTPEGKTLQRGDF